METADPIGMPTRFGDLLSDPRSPLHYRAVEQDYAKRKQIIDSAERQKDILFCLTVDVEQDYGSLSTGGKARTVSTFLESARQHFGDMGCGCLFVQGSLMKENSAMLREYTKAGYDVGLHGYNHELWGKPQWYLKDKPVSLERKKELLLQARQECSEIGIELTSFRAPNMVIDNETLSLLASERFLYDSSGAVHRGENPLPTAVNGLKRVPVSANPLPTISKKFGMKVHGFEVFNMFSVLKIDQSYLTDYVDKITRYQAANGVRPHLVFLCHSWEFFDSDATDPMVSYSSANNFVRLQECYQTIKKEFGCSSINFQDLCESITFS